MMNWGKPCGREIGAGIIARPGSELRPAILDRVESTVNW